MSNLKKIKVDKLVVVDVPGFDRHRPDLTEFLDSLWDAAVERGEVLNVRKKAAGKAESKGRKGSRTRMQPSRQASASGGAASQKRAGRAGKKRKKS